MGARLRGVFGAVLLALAQPLPAAAEPAPALLINADFADPDVLVTDEGHFAFSTSSVAGKVPWAAADAAQGPWTVRGDALARPPAWAQEGGGYWAPDVTRRADGTFVLYFSTNAKDGGQMCIGTATASTPGGPYEPVGEKPLICVPEDMGDIDPQTFVDEGDRRMLLYKSNGAPVGAPAAIWSQELSPDGLSVVGPRRELLRADLPVENSVVEAPSVVRRPSRYVLFYAADTFQSTGYHTSYATAPALAGPFVKSTGPLLSTDSLGRRADGPGGADVVGDHVFFHGWLTPEHRARGLYLLPIRFENDLPRVD